MADTIVKKFVIDTTESEQNLKELNTQINATSSAINQGAQSFENVAAAEESVVTSSKSLKAQLRELQAQLAATDPDSAKYRELAAAAGELKDRISDAAEAVGTQAGGAFERVGGSLGLVTSRIANLDFQGAAEGAKQLAANIGQVKPGDISKGIQSIGSAFGAVGKALLTNPIFLIGAAIAAAIVYAEELLSLIDGVTDAEQAALDVQKERAALAKENYDRISATEETLKRQGLTEKQITDLKLTQLNTAIAEQQAVVETTRIQAEAQIKAAERNAQYLKTFLDFVTFPQKKLAEFFQNFVNSGIEVLNKLGLGIEKIDVTKVFEDVNNFVVKQIFDPEAERKNQEKIVADATKSLENLVNTRDGILNAQAAKEKSAADKRAADAKAAADAQLKAAEELAAAEEALFDELLQSFEENEKAMTEIALKEKQKQLDAATTFYNKLAALSDSQFEASLTATEKEELAVTQKYEDLFASAEAYNATLKAGEEANAIDIVALQKQLAAELLEIQQKSAKDEGDVQDQQNQQSAERAQQIYQAKLQYVSDGFATIASLADAFGKGDEARAKKAFKIQKAASVAQATVDTYKAAQGIFANAALNPKTILFPAQPYIEAALAVAAGLVNVKKISSQQFQSSGTPPSTSTPPPSVGGGGGGESQPAQFNPLAAQFIQDRPEQLTPRAFVLAGDVASQQEVRQKVEDLARLG